LGITGFKGGVHVHFGTPIKNADSTRSVAEQIDRQIHQNFYLFPSNIAAAELLQWDVGPLLSTYDQATRDAAKKILRERVAGLPEAVAEKVFIMYANPVLNKLNNEVDT